MSQTGFRETTLQEVKNSSDSQALLIDLLPPEHFERRHLPGAKNACVYQVVFLDSVAQIVADKSLPIILYGAGAGAMDASVAAEKLTRAGYTDLAVFPGGIEAWAEAGLGLEGSVPQFLDPPYPVFSPQPKTYSMVDGRACLTWTGRNHNTSHHGSLSLSKAEMDFSQGIRGFFEIDMRSIANKNLEGDPLKEVLEGHLASDDFFFVSHFPSAVFTLSQAAPHPLASATNPNYNITGQLSLRGLSKSFSFPAHFRMLENGQIGLHANFDFDRTDWGIIYGSARFFRHLGMHLVYDQISLEARVVLA
jgi:polyisoprenoid-binding protein YceI/rhodanese-related sulfurtransferase